MTKASFLGTSGLADAFGIAFMIPNLFRRLFAENSISVAFIPTFRSYLEKTKTGECSIEETQQFVKATGTVVSFASAAAVILGMVFSPLIVPLFTGEETSQFLGETVFLTRLMFPYLLIISFAAFLQGILNGVRIFSPSGFTPILFNIIVIGSVYLLSPHTENPARAMAYGVLGGGIVQMIFQLPFVLKQGWSVSFTGLKKAFTNPGTRRVLGLIGPTVIGMAAYQINDVVSTALAGRTGVGIVSSLQYSLRLQELILGIFAVSIGTVILPDLSAHASTGKWKEFSSMLSGAMKIIALITIPVTFFSLLFGENLIVLIYKNNQFSDESVRLTTEAFMFHIAGLFFIALNRIISPAFYAQSDAKSPTIAGIAGFAVNILLALILSRTMRGAGIALALSIASFANTVMLIFFMRKNKDVELGSIVCSTGLYALKMIVLSAAACIPAIFAKKHLFTHFSGANKLVSQGLPVLLCAMIFGAVGILLLFITGDSQFRKITSKFFRKARR